MEAKGEMNKGFAVILRNVTKKFGDVVAVDNVSLELQKGEIFSLLGPSGCGKSTTMRLIGGFESSEHGEIYIDGELVNYIPPYKRDCSIVFQNRALFPHMTVAKNISFGLERRRVPKEEIKKQVKEVLSLVDLSEMENRLPDQLSGGQQQRIALARSIVLKPKVLLLDEPLSALDRKLRKEMQIELKRIHDEVGLTFLYVTHDQKEALSISDRIGVMRDGRIEQIGTATELYELPRTKFVANFIGGANVLNVKSLTKKMENKIELETMSGLKIIGELGDKPIESIVAFSIRPEVIDIYAYEDHVDQANLFDGIIQIVIFQGDFYEIEIKVEKSNDLIKVHFYHHKARSFFRKPPMVGDRVKLGWDFEDTNLLVK